MRRCSGSRLSAGGGVIAPLGRHRPPSIWRRREPTVFEELITEWTPPNTEAALGAGWGGARVQGLRVLAQVAEGQPARVVSATCTHCGARLRPVPSGGLLRCPADDSVSRRRRRGA